MATTPETTNTDPVFQIQRVYLKELSLEQPNSPAIFLSEDTPELGVTITQSSEALAVGIYEVCLTVTVTSTIKEKTVFLVEAKQAGIFEARHIPEDQLSPMLGIGCATIIYPYLRSNIADVITRSGFPPVHLAEINFEALYQQNQQAMAEAAAKDAK